MQSGRPRQGSSGRLTETHVTPTVVPTTAAYDSGTSAACLGSRLARRAHASASAARGRGARSFVRLATRAARICLARSHPRGPRRPVDFRASTRTPLATRGRSSASVARYRRAARAPNERPCAPAPSRTEPPTCYEARRNVPPAARARVRQRCIRRSACDAGRRCAPAARAMHWRPARVATGGTNSGRPGGSGTNNRGSRLRDADARQPESADAPPARAPASG
jgi:hypothetical protein